MADDHCTFVNPLCPVDLCVLEYGHPFSSRNRHITGTTYGSAYTSREEQLDILRRHDQSGWGSGFRAPQGTPVEDLIKMGWAEQDKMMKDEER